MEKAYFKMLRDKLIFSVQEEKHIFDRKITRQWVKDFVRKEIEVFKHRVEEQGKQLEISEEDIRTLQFEIGQQYDHELIDSGTWLGDSDAARWINAKRNDIEWNHWDAYRTTLIQAARPENVIDQNEKIIDSALDFTGDPTLKGPWSRKGLIMGNVQSGKTQNYLGLINKAIDCGYRCIILLGGHINDLRIQTQERVDESVIGRESKHVMRSQRVGLRRIGVGKVSPELEVAALTATGPDFNVAWVRSNNLSLNSINSPTIAVVKKQTTVLKNLYDWLLENHDLDLDNNKKLNFPLLLIDDEADYATVNTKASKNETTLTNQLIRQILSLFHRNTYIGYTATPFANIFIDPDSVEDSLSDDLFPKDFMAKIPVPDDYVGQNHFFEDPEESLAVQTNSDMIALQNLKKENLVEELPDSLEEAIRSFVIVIALRALRGEKRVHNSMLVNISHLVVQMSAVSGLIDEYLKLLKHALKANIGRGVAVARQNDHMQNFESTFFKVFDVDENYEDVFPTLESALSKIEVKAVHSKKNEGGQDLNYKIYEEHGLCVIVIGGHRLSRGLTLEGLSVSYFTRNSKAYDTLMQMCRWFGYRPRFKDLCRLWLTEDSLEWYSFMAEVIDELYGELERMSLTDARPKDFGLKVREHPGAMIITAKNKMGSAKSELRSLDLWGQTVRRFRFSVDQRLNDENIKTTKKLISNLEESCDKEKKDSGVIYKNVPYGELISFISNINHKEGHIEDEPLIKFLEKLQREGSISLPRICLYSPKKVTQKWEDNLSKEEDRRFLERSEYYLGNNPINLSKRSMGTDGRVISTPKSQLSGRSDEKIFLDDLTIKEIEKNKPNALNLDYLIHKERNFLGLIIYCFGIATSNPAYSRSKNPDTPMALAHGHSPTIGYSLSIPLLDNMRDKDGKTIKDLNNRTRISYSINKVYQEQLKLALSDECDYDD